MPMYDYRDGKDVLYKAPSEPILNRGVGHNHGTLYVRRGDHIKYVSVGGDQYDPDQYVYLESGGKVLTGTPPYNIPQAEHNHDWLIHDGFPHQFTAKTGYFAADPAVDSVVARFIVHEPPYELWIGCKRVWHRKHIVIDSATPRTPAPERWLKAGDQIEWTSNETGTFYFEQEGQVMPWTMPNGRQSVHTAIRPFTFDLTWAHGYRPKDMTWNVRFSNSTHSQQPKTDPILMVVHFDPPADASDIPTGEKTRSTTITSFSPFGYLPVQMGGQFVWQPDSATQNGPGRTLFLERNGKAIEPSDGSNHFLHARYQNVSGTSHITQAEGFEPCTVVNVRYTDGYGIGRDPAGAGTFVIGKLLIEGVNIGSSHVDFIDHTTQHGNLLLNIDDIINWNPDAATKRFNGVFYFERNGAIMTTAAGVNLVTSSGLSYSFVLSTANGFRSGMVFHLRMATGTNVATPNTDLILATATIR